LSKVSYIDLPHLHLSLRLVVIQFEFRWDLWRQKTRIPGLSCGIDRVTLRLVVLIWYRCMTHRETDRQTDRHTTTA